MFNSHAGSSSSHLSAAKRRFLEDDEIMIPKTRRDVSDEEEYPKTKSDKKKHKKESKSKKKKKSKKKHKRKSSDDSSSDSEDGDDWVEKPNKEVAAPVVERDDWMTNSVGFATFTRKEIRPDPQEKKDKAKMDTYVPSESSRELNPYWKNGGTGLPSAEMPNSKREQSQSSRDSNKDQHYSSSEGSKMEQSNSSIGSYKNSNKEQSYSSLKDSKRESSYRDSNKESSRDVKSFKEPSSSRADSYRDRERRSGEESSCKSKDRQTYDDFKSQRKSSGFKKPSYYDDDDEYKSRKSSHQENKERNEKSYSSSRKNWQRKEEKRERSPSPEVNIKDSVEDLKVSSKPIEEENVKSSEYLTDEQMNALGAKIIKAEILGNKKLVAELQSKIEAARMYRKEHPEAAASNKKEEAVVLTMTDDKGNSRPLTKNPYAGDAKSKGGKKKTETHVDGERMRFFADDDRHSLKDMFEKEKYNNANQSQAEFADIISKHKNPNDDLEDIFAEKITKNKSEAKTEAQELNKAISQHQRVQKSLDNCEYCIESKKMLKHLIVSLGEKAYVSLPAKKSVTEGHCIISTVRHVQCSTYADEDVWSEIMTYRRALTNMFNSRDEDVVFFETASYLHKHPHLVIQCIPIPRDVGDTAPVYFKKALLECEAEWSTNKKVVDLKGKDIRRGIPKGLPYFWVDFGMDPGFGHVIEDQELFPMNFAQEIIGGMLDLDHGLWRKPQREMFAAQSKKVLQFNEAWKAFDPLVKQ